MLGERGEALEVGEQQADLSLLAAEAGLGGVGCELARELGRQVRPEQPVDAVDLAGGALEHEPLVAAETQAVGQLVSVRIGQRAASARGNPAV